MNGQKSKCGVCNHLLGKGKNLKTGAEIAGVSVIFQDPRVPQLQGLRARGTMYICIDCATEIANRLNKLQVDSVIVSKDLRH